MKIKGIYMYQAVRVGRFAAINYINRANSAYQDVEMSFHKDLGVLVKDATVKCIIPFTNISMVELEYDDVTSNVSEAVVAKNTKSSKKLDDKEQV